MSEKYEVFVCKDYFKFNAAHFMAYPGFRERLHGHNYRVSVRVEGALGDEGYVVDFGDIKTAARAICEAIDERTIVPMQSDCLKIDRRDGQIEVLTEDGSRFSFPEDDCALLPIRHSSAFEYPVNSQAAALTITNCELGSLMKMASRDPSKIACCQSSACFRSVTSSSTTITYLSSLPAPRIAEAFVEAHTTSPPGRM